MHLNIFLYKNFCIYNKYIHWIFKIFINLTIILFLIFYNKNNPIIMKEIYFKKLPLKYLYLILKEKPKDENSLLIILYFNKERKYLLNYISKRVGNNIKSVYSIFIGQVLNFGNQLKLMNNAIFYCEILGCKRLVFNKKNIWFIKNKIFDKKYKMIIELGDKKNYINKNILFDYSKFMYYYSKFIKPEFKVNILKKEILRNIPKIKCLYNDLIIFIRSGDIFIKAHRKYAQPPLCFYEKIIKYNKFNKIIIIAKDKNNPLINILLNKYSNIIYNKNSLKIDLGYLVNSYNLVGCFSTLIYIITLNGPINRKKI